MKRVLPNTLVLIIWLLAPPVLLAQHTWENVSKIVAVGDVHGDYENFVQVLRDAGIINRRRNWVADDTHLVQLGDLPDRGPDTDKAIGLLMKLERQAQRRGGKVHVLIGNHEAMNMLGDLRYVHPGEFEAFVNRDSERLRDRWFELVVQQQRSANPDFLANEEFIELFNQQVPLGYVEHRIAWSPEGEYGSWVLEHNAVIKINDTLFLHGGLGPQVLGMGIGEINERVLDELRLGEAGQAAEPAESEGSVGTDQTEEPGGADQTIEAGLATSEGGPLWYRGMARNDESLESAHVDAVLAYYGVNRIVVGHTPGLATIVPRFDARVLVVDSGISSYYGGHLASLTIEGDRLVNTQRGEQLEIPDNKDDLISYFEAVLKLEPGEAALERHIDSLINPPQVPEPQIQEQQAPDQQIPLQ